MQAIVAKPAPTENFPTVLRYGARVVSLLLHPLFIPVYLIWFLLHHTALFPGFSAAGKNALLIRFFVMYSLFPGVTVALAKALGFVGSITLKTQKDRIIPYVACGVYYFWMWYVLRNQPQYPKEIVAFSLAIFIASSGGLIINSYLKISMHAIAVGVMLAFMYGISLRSSGSLGLYLSIALLVTGLVCTARLVNNDHRPAEIYLGLALGVVSQVVAFWFI